MGRDPCQPQVYWMWMFWPDLLPMQSGSADCCWRKIVFKYALSYSIVLFYSMKTPFKYHIKADPISGIYHLAPPPLFHSSIIYQESFYAKSPPPPLTLSVCLRKALKGWSGKAY